MGGDVRLVDLDEVGDRRFGIFKPYRLGRVGTFEQRQSAARLQELKDGKRNVRTWKEN